MAFRCRSASCDRLAVTNILDLIEQNKEKTTRLSTAPKVVGHAKVVGYEDILEVQRKRDVKAVSRLRFNRLRSQAIDETSARQEEQEG
jgi:hypothetical protein